MPRGICGRLAFPPLARENWKRGAEKNTVAGKPAAKANGKAPAGKGSKPAAKVTKPVGKVAAKAAPAGARGATAKHVAPKPASKIGAKPALKAGAKSTQSGAKLTAKASATKIAPKPAPAKAAVKTAPKTNAPQAAPKPAAKIAVKGSASNGAKSQGKAPVKPSPKPAAAGKAAAKAPVKAPAKPPAKAVAAPAKAAPAKSAPVAAKAVPAPAKSAAASKAAGAPGKVAVNAAKPVATAAKPASTATKAVPDKRRILAHKNKVLPREFLVKLAEAIRVAVLPMVLEAKGREIVGQALSGDTTFELDEVAERALLQHLKSQRAPVAYYSEDSGYSTFSNAQPKNLLVVDPVDGTRAAKSGFEACVISIATTRIIERPVMSDVDNALIMEIISGRTFYAERGGGVKISHSGVTKKPKLSDNTDLEAVAWSMTVPGRPAELIFPTAARFIDLTSLKGGFFACNSTAFSLTRLVTNQLDACVDFAGRYYRDIPEIVRDYFLNAGRGNVLGIAPYDMVAALLIAQEAGCKVTNAYGKSFDDVMLLDSTPNNHQTLIAAANPELYQKLFNYFDTRITQYENLLKRRAAASNA